LLRMAQAPTANLVQPRTLPSPPPSDTAPPPPPVAGRSVVSLRYREKRPIHVRGPATGLVYHFSETNPVRGVDARDAAALLRTRYFQRAT
jgi:hypothetical protein